MQTRKSRGKWLNRNLKKEPNRSERKPEKGYSQPEKSPIFCKNAAPLANRTGQAFKAGSHGKGSMDKKERELVEGIYRDCLRLKKRKELTEFGEGQMAVCGMLLGLDNR